MERQRIGVIGTSNTHAYGLIGLLNGWRPDVPFPERFPDGRPSGLMHQAYGTHLREASRLFPESLDFAADVTRLWPETEDAGRLLEQACGVQVVGTPEDAARDVDAVLVLSEDPGRHLDHAAFSLDTGLPTYIDKPLARDEDQARAIAERAAAARTPWFSCSLLRFCPGLDTLADSIHRDYGGAQSVYIQCPLRAEAYAPHSVEMMAVLMNGHDVVNIATLRTATKDVAVLDLTDGRSATLEHNGPVDRMSYTAVVQSRLRQHIWTGEDFGLARTRFLRTFATFIETGQPPITPDDCLRSFELACRINHSLNAS